MLRRGRPPSALSRGRTRTATDNVACCVGCSGTCGAGRGGARSLPAVPAVRGSGTGAARGARRAAQRRARRRPLRGARRHQGRPIGPHPPYVDDAADFGGKRRARARRAAEARCHAAALRLVRARGGRMYNRRIQETLWRVPCLPSGRRAAVRPRRAPRRRTRCAAATPPPRRPAQMARPAPAGRDPQHATAQIGTSGSDAATTCRAVKHGQTYGHREDYPRAHTHGRVAAGPTRPCRPSRPCRCPRSPLPPPPRPPWRPPPRAASRAPSRARSRP
jgi:hypothetical protein